jgi:hypothetical protein
VPFDPFPDDHDVSNPEAKWDDPGSNVPQVGSSDGDGPDIDPEVATTFWRSVLLANVALFGMTLGPMLVYFRGQWAVGVAAVVVGAITGLRVYQHYRAFDDEHNA